MREARTWPPTHGDIIWDEPFGTGGRRVGEIAAARRAVAEGAAALLVVSGVAFPELVVLFGSNLAEPALALLPVGVVRARLARGQVLGGCARTTWQGTIARQSA